jgi:uncharacterized membrane protein
MFASQNQWQIFLRRTSILAIVTAVYLLTIVSCSTQPHYPIAEVSGQNVIVDPAVLQPGVPKFYSFLYHHKTINFFVLKIQDKVTSFLDACASCYSYKQGYRCEEGSVICRHCNMKFPVHKLEQGLGSCFPIKIEGKMENGKYLISTALLEAQADKF